MYWLIIAGEQIVDACERLDWVKWQSANRVWISCAEGAADGIVTSDGGTIYTLDGKTVDGYAGCEIRETDEETWREIREELDEGSEVPAPDEPEPEPDMPKTRFQILEEKLAEQAEEITSLKEDKQMLIECVLEMSQVVYGGDLM